MKLLPLAVLVAVITFGVAPTWPQRGSAPPQAAKRAKAPPPAPERQGDSGPAGSLAALHATRLRTSPSGSPTADLVQGAVVQPLARERGWVRVRLEGWVEEKDFTPSDSSFAAGLSAADLRANPEGSRGKVVRWQVQVLSFQLADPLRKDLARDEPYLLAKGPASENAMLYLAIPPSLLNEAKALAPLSTLMITARVRNGRSEPVGTPILDLQSFSKP